MVVRLRSDGFTVSANRADTNLDNQEWTNFELHYNADRLPLLIELNQVGHSDGMAEEEIEEFVEFVGTPGFFDGKKKKIIRHLKGTQYIVCIQLSTSDIVDEGHDLNGALMSFLEQNFIGLTQADWRRLLSEF